MVTVVTMVTMVTHRSLLPSLQPWLRLLLLGHPLWGHKGHGQGTAEASIPPAAGDSLSAHLQHRAPRQEPQAHQERLVHQGHQELQEDQQCQEHQERQEHQEHRQCQEHQLLQGMRWGKSDLAGATAERYGLFLRASISEPWLKELSIHSHFQETPNWGRRGISSMSC